MKKNYKISRVKLGRKLRMTCCAFALLLCMHVIKKKKNSVECMATIIVQYCV